MNKFKEITLSVKYKLSSIYQTFLLIVGVLVTGALSAQDIDSSSIVYQPNASLSSEITYYAKDSVVSSPKDRVTELYNEAYIKYQDFELKAGYIRFNMNTNMVYAHGLRDSLDHIIQQPIFTQGGKSYDSDTILFNMKSKKGKIQQVFTKEGEGYLYGYDIKKMPDNSFYFKNGIYTTCDHPEPHFYIKASKLKVTNDRKIVTGPANLVIAGVKTPLVLPFGYFPMEDKKSIGIVLPSYNFSETRGYSLNGLGFYIGLSEYWDNRTTFDLYTGGSFKVDNTFRYSKRYKFNGNFAFQYSNTTNLIDATQDENNYSIIWRHYQDPKANPFGKFTANVDLTSRGFNQNNNQAIQSQVKSTYYSSINYTRSLFNNKAALTLNADHSMNNTGNNPVTMNLPNLTLRSNQSIFPFRTEKNRIKQTILSKVNFNPTLVSKTMVNTYDSLMFTSSMFDDINFGAKYDIPVNLELLNSNVFSISPSFNYYGLMYTKKYSYTWNEEEELLIRQAQDGIYHLFDYNASLGLSISPTIFGLFPVNGKKVKAIRHRLTPSADYTYNLNFLDNNRYYQDVQINSEGDRSYLSQYGSDAIYNTPGNPSYSNERNWGPIRLKLANNIEVKVLDDKLSKEDSIKISEGENIPLKYKKIKILDALDFSSSYSFDADSFRLEPIRIYSRTKLGKSLNITNTIYFDPYSNDGTKRFKKYFWEKSGNNGFVNSVITSLSYSLAGKSKSGKSTLDKVSSINQSDFSDGELRTISEIQANPHQYLDFDIPYTLNLSYSLNYRASIGQPHTISQNLSFNGDINLTEQWKIGFNSGYDITNNKISDITSISFDRDLHCWQMSFTWQPFGIYRSYGFEIRVKASVLQDLKLNKRRPGYDVLY